MSDQQSERNSMPQQENDQQNQRNKIFKFENGKIHYCNLEQTLINQNKDSPLLVHNYLCYQEDDRLIKITQIIIQDKVLRIKDELKIITQLNQGEREQKRRVGVFGRRNNYSDPTKDEKSDTKNLIKNIVNLFANWLRIKNTQFAEKASRKLKSILKKKKYFNKLLVQQLCKDYDICNCFLQFSETDSQTAIENSRIKDKTCHFKALRNYKKLFEQSKQKLEKQLGKSTNNSPQN